MKAQTIILALAALAAAACTKNVPEAGIQDRTVMITASMEGPRDTKSGIIDEGTQVGWEYGDNIKVFFDGVGSEFTPLITVRDGEYRQEDLKKLYPVVNFSGKLDNIPIGGNLDKKLWGLYPYRSDATSDGNTVTTTLPDDQVGMPGSFFKRTQITLACASSLILPFYNVTGGIRFTVSQSGIKKVVLESNAGEDLAGTVKLGFENGVPVIKSVPSGAKSISLTAPQGGEFKTGRWYYIVTLPVQLSGGFKMYFHKNSTVGVKEVTSAVTINRGVFGSVSNIDQGVTFSSSARAETLPKIHDGDEVLATNPLVERFLTEVSYPENDYTYSSLLDYPPVAPGQADIPPTYWISCGNPLPSGGTATLTDADWSRTITLPAGATGFEVTNLRPNATYTYAVQSGGSTVTSGSFTTTGHLHQLYFRENVRNCRDLGGWTGLGGKKVKYRKVYRGGRLQWAVPHGSWTEEATLSQEGLEDVLAEGIKAQLELRNSNDAISETALGAGYAFCAPIISEGYTYMLRPDRGLTGKTRQCFEFIVDCVRNDKPVYFHCSLGRDRTGTVAMLVLGVLGVNEGDISKEYEVTQFSPHYWGVSDGEKTIMTRLADYDGAARYIWDNFVTGSMSFADGVEQFLLSIGVSQQDITDFRNLMLE
ncbi:MAG: tyrosine-protein phosphatase [Bacteroidales bacterium]|nr:tyrosine-protein phosphatase [Bacteroidales bacterium]